MCAFSKSGQCQRAHQEVKQLPAAPTKVNYLGLSKRYITTSDTPKTYEVLMRQGWTRLDIEKVRPKSSYKDRVSIVSEFMFEQERRNAGWTAEHTDEELWLRKVFNTPAPLHLRAAALQHRKNVSNKFLDNNWGDMPVLKSSKMDWTVRWRSSERRSSTPPCKRTRRRRRHTRPSYFYREILNLN